MRTPRYFIKLFLLLPLLWLALPAAAQHRPRPKKAGSRPRAAAPARSSRTSHRQPVAPRRSSGRRSTGPSKEQLERERRANLARIREAGQVLTQTREKKQATLGQLTAIEQKLTVKQGQIQHISTQLQGIDHSVHQTVREVLTTQEQLHQLKQEYARLLYTASKASAGYNQLLFLFAADSFNELVRRLRYVRQYTGQRQLQAMRIVGTQHQLSEQLDGLAAQRQRQKRLLTSQLTESQNLIGLKNEQSEVVQQLSRQEQGLRQELAERQQAVARLDNLIAQRVREEIARAARTARLAAASRRRGSHGSAGRRSRADDDATDEGSGGGDPSANPDSDAPEETAADRHASRVALTPETAALSSNFADNRGRLPWPVAHGFLAQRFGRHPHPVLRHVTVDNRGVDIQTNADEPVRAVFAGRVLTVAQVPGMNNIVMVQHGEYFTVYARLRSVSVHEGQELDARDTIGTAATDADGTTQVQFQLWRNSANLNPENWLGRR